MKPNTNAVQDALETLIADLHGRGRLRVWSLVITVFGDAVAPRGGQLPLQVLQSLMERMGIEPGALRTALSRLASEGWVVRRREGRNSYYRLADQGRHAFDEATQRIYAASAPHWNGRWSVAISLDGNPESDSRLEAGGFVRRGDGVWVRPDISGAASIESNPANILMIRGASDAVPKNVHTLWDTAEIAVALLQFADAVRPLAVALEGEETPDPADAMAARTLLIHDWRRIILRAPALPSALLPPDWPGGRVRNLVKRIYARIAAPSEAWLDEAGMPPVKDMAGFSDRFGIVSRIRNEEIEGLE